MRVRNIILWACCFAVLATMCACVPTFGNEYVHIRLKVPKVVAKNAHDNVHKLENVAKQHKHQHQHGAKPAIIHHHHHHHHHAGAPVTASRRPSQRQQQQQHQRQHQHHSHHQTHHNHHQYHRDHSHKQQHHSHGYHPHHRDPDHILDSVLVSELKEAANIASDHIEYLNHAHDIAAHVSTSLESHRPNDYVETYKIIEEKPAGYHQPQGYQYHQPTTSSIRHNHNQEYHTISTATASIAPSNDYLPPPSTSAPLPTHPYKPSYAPAPAPLLPSHQSASYAPPAQITSLNDVLDSYQSHYSDVREPSPRPVYGPPSIGSTSSIQPSYAAYTQSSKPTYSSYKQMENVYVPPLLPVSPPPPATHAPASVDYQGYEQPQHYATATTALKPSLLYHGYGALEGSNPTGYQQLSDGYLPPDTLVPPHGEGYSNVYEDQTLAGVGETENDIADSGGGGGGLHASETYMGIDSYRAAHVQGVGSGGYAYGGTYS